MATFARGCYQSDFSCGFGRRKEKAGEPGKIEFSERAIGHLMRPACPVTITGAWIGTDLPEMPQTVIFKELVV